MKKRLILSFIAILLLFSCEKKPSIEGLWIVESVMVGKEKVTPNARWARFNSDFTQESGNGRFQHSYGTWKLNTKSKELTINNLNGLEDLNAPFKVTVNQNEMLWERTEEGQNMKVTLVRSSKLPETYGDRILGLWNLESTTGDGYYFEETAKKGTSAYIFFRWDRRFVIQSEKGRINGVYNVHGHKPEVELIPYGDEFKRDFWKIQFEKDNIILTLLNSEKTVESKFKRINRFPD